MAANAMRTVLKDDLKKILLDLTPDDVTVTRITELFSDRYSAKDKKIIPPIIPRNSKFNLKAGEYINKKDITTIPGVFLFHKLCIEGTIDKIIPDGYLNVEKINNDTLMKINDYIFNSVMNKTLSIEDLQKYTHRLNFWSLKLVAIFSPSFTPRTINQIPEVQEKKQELLEKAKEKYGSIENIPAEIMTDIEDELVSMSREILKGDPGMTLYDSGARGSFDNDYKNCCIMVGPTMNPATGKFDLIESNYIGGISKDDLAKAGNLVVNAGYPKAVGTQDSGYLTKKFYAAFQSVVIDKEGTDCGSQGYIEDVLNDDTKKDFILMYINDNGRLVLITEDNYELYKGRKLKRRSPMFCIGDKICNKCAGDRFIKYGILNAGASTVSMTNDLLNKSMKNFHNAKVKYDEVNLDALLI
jgi:hypothetical protein